MAKMDKLPRSKLIHRDRQKVMNRDQVSTKIICFTKNYVKEAIQKHLASQTQTQTKLATNQPANQSIKQSNVYTQST